MPFISIIVQFRVETLRRRKESSPFSIHIFISRMMVVVTVSCGEQEMLNGLLAHIHRREDQVYRLREEEERLYSSVSANKNQTGGENKNKNPFSRTHTASASSTSYPRSTTTQARHDGAQHQTSQIRPNIPTPCMQGIRFAAPKPIARRPR